MSTLKEHPDIRRSNIIEAHKRILGALSFLDAYEPEKITGEEPTPPAEVTRTIERLKLSKSDLEDVIHIHSWMEKI